MDGQTNKDTQREKQYLPKYDTVQVEGVLDDACSGHSHTQDVL